MNSKKKFIILSFCIKLIIIFEMISCNENQSEKINHPKSQGFLNHPLENAGKFILYYKTSLECYDFGKFLLEDSTVKNDSIYLLSCELNLTYIDSNRTDGIILGYDWFKNGKLIWSTSKLNYHSILFKNNKAVKIYVNDRFSVDIDETELFRLENRYMALSCIEQNKHRINPWFIRQMEKFK